MADPKIRLMNTDRRLRSAVRHSLAVLLATTALGVVSAHAVDGTWVGATTEWIDPANWTSNPDLPDGTATFTNNGASATVDVNGLVIIGAAGFTGTAPAYTININDVFGFNGTGVTNNSAATQTFNVLSALVFQNSSSASAGAGPVTYNNGGTISFQNTSTAGTATITNNGSLEFNDTSTAATATITNNATVNFQDASSAGSAGITNNAIGRHRVQQHQHGRHLHHRQQRNAAILNSSSAGGATITTTSSISSIRPARAAPVSPITSTATLTFNDTATAGSATIGNDGTVTFRNSSSGGTSSAHLNNNAGGTWNFNDTSTAGAAIFVNDGDLSFNNTARAGTSNLTNTAFVNFNDGASADHAVDRQSRWRPDHLQQYQHGGPRHDHEHAGDRGLCGSEHRGQRDDQQFWAERDILQRQQFRRIRANHQQGHHRCSLPPRSFRVLRRRRARPSSTTSAAPPPSTTQSTSGHRDDHQQGNRWRDRRRHADVRLVRRDRYVLRRSRHHRQRGRRVRPRLRRLHPVPGGIDRGRRDDYHQRWRHRCVLRQLQRRHGALHHQYRRLVRHLAADDGRNDRRLDRRRRHVLSRRQAAHRRRQQSFHHRQRHHFRRHLRLLRTRRRRRLAGQGRHRLADAVRHQHLHRRDHGQCRQPDRRRFDRAVVADHGECRRHAGGQRHRRQYRHYRRHPGAGKRRRQRLRAADRAGQPLVHGGFDLHDPGLARQCRPHQRLGRCDTRRRHGERDVPARQLCRPAVYHRQRHRRRQRHLQSGRRLQHGEYSIDAHL